MIELRQNVSIDKIEQAYIALSNDNSTTLALKIPLKIDNKSFSIVPSFIQFVSTWIRNNPKGTLTTAIKSELLDFERQLEKQVEDECGFTSIIMAWKQPILDISGKDIKYFFKPYTQVVHEQMDKFLVSEMKGDKLFLTCFDHLNKEKGLLKCFYLNHEEFQSEKSLTVLLQKGLRDSVLKGIKISRSSLYPILVDLKAIVYELMHNTNEWAKTDENNVPLNPNIRGLYIKFHKSKKDSYIEKYRNHVGLSEYFKHNQFKHNNNNELYFIEVSIFDSGPGLVRRFTQKSLNDFSGEEEVKIIKLCLSKQRTSLKDAKNDRGIGLDRVLNTINNKGFLRIRTGRKALYRDMISFPYDSEKERDNVKLFDWQTNNLNSFTTMPHAEGTLITIVYPIDFVQINQKLSLF